MFWLKLIGWGWLVAGAAGVLWIAFTVLSIPPLGRPVMARDPETQVVIDAVVISPWIELAILSLFLFAMAVGWGLVRRRSWAQTLLVPAHLLIAIYAIVGWIAAYVISAGSQAWWEGVSLLFMTAILANVGMVIWMNSAGTTEALSWLPLQTVMQVAEQCEFCGSPLDLETGRCPHCEAVPELVQKNLALTPPRAKLVDLASDVEHWIDPDEGAFIGRGTSENDIDLSNPTVSRRHAHIEYHDEHFVLTALRDSNGTFVNDTLVRQRTLRDGDEVRFGRARFRFAIVAPGEANGR